MPPSRRSGDIKKSGDLPRAGAAFSREISGLWLVARAEFMNRID